MRTDWILDCDQRYGLVPTSAEPGWVSLGWETRARLGMCGCICAWKCTQLGSAFLQDSLFSLPSSVAESHTSVLASPHTHTETRTLPPRASRNHSKGLGGESETQSRSLVPQAAKQGRAPAHLGFIGCFDPAPLCPPRVPPPSQPSCCLYCEVSLMPPQRAGLSLLTEHFHCYLSTHSKSAGSGTQLYAQVHVAAEPTGAFIHRAIQWLNGIHRDVLPLQSWFSDNRLPRAGASQWYQGELRMRDLQS